MNHNKLTLIIFFIAYPIYLDISIEEDVNLIAAIVTQKTNLHLAYFPYNSHDFVNYFYVWTHFGYYGSRYGKQVWIT